MGNRVYPRSNPVDVSIQDQTSNSFGIYFHVHTGNITLATDTDLDDTSITLEAGHGAVAGELVCLKENERYYQGTILTVVDSTITLDTPLDYAFTVAGSCSKTTSALNVNGSVTPVVFHIKPLAGVLWDINKIKFVISDATAMDSAMFGGITALTKGIVIRKRDGTYKNFANIKNNGEFDLHGSTKYDDKAPSGVYNINAELNFNSQTARGVAVRLDGNSDDELEVIVQDDLTGLTRFNIIALGHIVV